MGGGGGGIGVIGWSGKSGRLEQIPSSECYVNVTNLIPYSLSTTLPAVPL